MLGSSHTVPEVAEPAPTLMHEVGAALREARRQRGKAIEDVAEILRIQPAYLVGLEQGDLSVIPGRTYALGFLRSYAQYLGFDGDDLIAQIRSSMGLTRGAALQGRAPLTESRLPKVPILVVSLAALAGAYAGWAYVDGGKAPPELVEEVPDALREGAPGLPGWQAAPPVHAIPALAPPAPGPGEAATPSTGDGAEAMPSEPGAAEPPVPAPAGTTPKAAPQAATRPQTPPAERAVASPAPLHQTAPAGDAAGEIARTGQSVIPAMVEADATDRARAEPAEANRDDARGRDVPLPAMALAPEARPLEVARAREGRLPEVEPLEAVPAPESQLAVEAAAETRPPRTYGTASAGSRVVLRARDRAWVHVSSTNNDYLWVQTLRQGDRFMVPARPDLVLWTGNAGGVEVLVDGALLPPLGPDAMVVRDVSLQPRALLRRLLPLPADDGGVSDLASAAKPPMMPPSSR